MIGGQCHWSFVRDILGYQEICFENLFKRQLLEIVAIESKFFYGQWIIPVFMAQTTWTLLSVI